VRRNSLDETFAGRRARLSRVQSDDMRDAHLHTRTRVQSENLQKVFLYKGFAVWALCEEAKSVDQKMLFVVVTVV